MNWNDSQRQAIENRGKNIIVSAAAGSGKTAVLVERILRLIIEDNVRVDELLVVTFTKAAAAEMKGKIEKAIKKAIKEGRGGQEQRQFLKEQLDLLGQSSISTFHAFAMDIIKNYYYVANISPYLKPADETQVAIMKLNAMDQVFAEAFEKENKDSFIKFLNHYSSHKNEKSIKESLLNVYEKISAMEEPFKWLEEKVEIVNHYDDLEVIRQQEIVPIIIKFYMSELIKMYNLKAAIIDILQENGLDKMATKQMADLDLLKALGQSLYKDYSIENFDKIRSHVEVIKFTTLRASKEEKEEYELIKDKIAIIRKKLADKLKDLKEDFCQPTVLEMFASAKEIYPYLKEVQTLLIAFNEKYTQMKLDKTLMDFNDMEHYALEILKNPQVSDELRNGFKYIFVDEYQDSNYIQEAIISKIKRENNLFVVGDLKQSIYSFRLAEPEIFKARYKEYQNDSQSVKIDLNQNFRCKKNIINGVNDVFQQVMSGYDDNAKLHKGVENDPIYDYPLELIIAQSQFEGMDSDEFKDLLEMKQSEMEAMACAKEINKLISSGRVIYDNKTSETRTIEYRDIVILIRSVRQVGDVFKKVLSKEGIPVYLNNNGGYFETVEIGLLLNLLKVIDNPYNDIPLISVMYSSIFNFSIDQLMDIRRSYRKETFYNAILEYGQNGTNKEIIDKIGIMIDKLEKWQLESKFMPLDKFVWRVIQESGIYADAGLKNGGIQRQLNLRTFVDKTKVYLNLGENSIYGLLNYFEIVKSNIETGPVSLVAKDENTVQITTIHKSKGLEYPIVIIPSLSKNYMRKMGDGQISVNRKIGIAMKTYLKENGAMKDNILTKVMDKLKAKEMMEEEIRILYVAMTRGKDQLIMIANVKNYEEYIEMFCPQLDKQSYLDCIIEPALSSKTFNVKVLTKDQIFSGEKDENQGKVTKGQLKKVLNSNVSKDDISYINDKMTYIYPYKEQFKIKSKYGVTEINRKNKENFADDIIEPDFMKKEGKGTITSTHYGNVYHSILEHMDFQIALNEGRGYIENLIDELLEKGYLTEEEKNVVKINKLTDFIQSPIGQRASKSICYKERPFTMKHSIDGCDTLVQGIIDCYFEEENELVLVDYKTGSLKEETLEAYETQIYLYKEALEKSTGKIVKEGWIYFIGNSRAHKVF